ncbi:MAG: 50S ribosomal protein L15 [Pseudomonadales bacterium]|nr:50S ribosomal protein L15 [Candidatus Woesebacteria bacterium]MCB9801723.1 50S ribosomal protein L15 [Pseudomonadales bacterium]
MSLLNSLSKTTTKSKKRVGRGYGSGVGGHTSGRGMKGQKSRTGANIPLWFEGGQLPLIKRLPMLRGKGRFKVVRPTAEITLSELERMSADTITRETLVLENVIDPAFKKAKVIASGTIKRRVTLSGIKVSDGARSAITAAGGSVE